MPSAPKAVQRLQTSGAEPLEFKHSGSFAYETLRTRMPVNLTRATDYLSRRLGQDHDEGASPQATKAGRAAIARLAKLKYEMQTAKPMALFENEDGRDTDNDVIWWRQEFERFSSADAPPTWWTAPWLFSECYMYRAIRHICTSCELLADIDPFQESKETSLKCSWKAIKGLGEWLLVTTSDAAGVAVERRARTFELLLQFSLWANKSDLSLLSDFDGGSSLDHMQAGSEEHLQELLSHILHNDDSGLWRHIQDGRGAQLDIVLDNAGFELFADCCLAHWLVQNGYYERVVFHGKAFPWFVSDVTRRDVDWTLQQLIDSGDAALAALGRAWRTNIDQGVWQYETHPFWTTSLEFACMEEAAPDLYAQLGRSHLIIFKGDLNGRKLLADLKWPVDTPFETALCGFHPAPLCLLRTLKSNTIAGVAKDKADAAASQDADWLVSGNYAVIHAYL